MSSPSRKFCIISCLGGAIAIASLLVLSTPGLSADETTVFLNAKVFTADGGNRLAEGFAVKGDRFVAVGNRDALKPFIDGGADVVDLQGRFVTPGLADGHLHNEGGGPGLDFSRVRTMPDLLAVVREGVAKAAPGTVVVSNSDWHEMQLKEQRLPTVDDLDPVSGDVPVVLVRGGHSLILNSAALKKFNITPETQSPAGGIIGRSGDGRLTGEIVDTAKRLVELPPRPRLSRNDLIATQKALNAYGITAIRIPGVYKGPAAETFRLARELEREGQLTLRYTILLPGPHFRDGSMEKLKTGPQQDEGDEWVRIGGVKLGVDGGFEGGHFREPYVEPYGKQGAYRGVTTFPVAEYNQTVAELNRNGWLVATHAVGDAALDQVLDAYETANKEKSIVGRRWSIEHAFYVHPAQIKRMQALQLVLSVQDHLYLAAPAMLKYWGRERADHVTPVKSFLQSGLIVAGGTDSPVIPFNPFWEIYHFASRDTIAGGVYGADEQVDSRSDLLRMITINFARMIGADSVRGSIEPGKLADFAVLSEDLLTAPLSRVRDTKALTTYVAGKEVYRDPGFPKAAQAR
jgi:predicted amidohydrolase YtcJ